MDSLFYSISGLPVHALIVHFAVVLLPLSCAALLVSIYMPKFKSKYSLASVVGIVLGMGSAVIAKQSGEALAAKIGNPAEHSKLGNILPLFAFVLACAAVLWFKSNKGRASRSVTPLGHTTAVLSIAVMALTFLVGHTGAQAVWQGRLPEATKATATPTPTATKTTTTKQTTYTMADVKKHAKPASCWSVINGNVYDLTKWINRHPGGTSVIISLCGRDGSSMFNGQHGGQNRPANELAGFKIGKLG